MLLLLIVLFTLTTCSSSYIFPCYYLFQPWLISSENIPIDICTHIIVGGCIDEKHLLAETHDKPINCSNALEKIVNVRKKNRNLKFLISMANNDTSLHTIVQDLRLMENYIDSIVKLVIQYDYDGVDLDWEFPCLNNDRYLFTVLLKMLRQRLGASKLLTAAIGAPVHILETCYDLPGLSQYLDYINVMCYNYNTIYNKKTAYTSPLYARPEEQGDDALLNTNATIVYMLENNVPKEKIVLGLSADGHTFQLADTSSNGFHASVIGVGFGDGWTTYPELCQMVQNGAISVYDEVARFLYVYYDDQWVNAGDIRSAVDKVKYAKAYNLAGVFTYCLNLDDIFNVCGHNVTFPLHRAIRDELFSNQVF